MWRVTVVSYPLLIQRHSSIFSLSARCTVSLYSIAKHTYETNVARHFKKWVHHKMTNEVTSEQRAHNNKPALATTNTYPHAMHTQPPIHALHTHPPGVLHQHGSEIAPPRAAPPNLKRDRNYWYTCCSVAEKNLTVSAWKFSTYFEKWAISIIYKYNTHVTLVTLKTKLNVLR